jgi:hypothetical protein
VKRLLEEAEGETTFDPAVLATAQAQYEKLEPILQKILKLRNKLFAHRDRLLDYPDVWKDVRVTGNDFRDAVDGFFKILDPIFRHRKQGVELPRDTSADHDTHRMLETLKASALTAADSKK